MGKSPAADAALARRLSRDASRGSDPGIAAAWDYLADFLLRHEMVLDSIEHRNILLTSTGTICLADAVSFPPNWLEHREAACRAKS